jgi:hypothetical protein
MDERQRRVVENEARFRLVNERIRAVVRSDGPPQEPAERIAVVCECGHADCTQQIDVPPAAYEWTRQLSSRFVIVKGHEIPDLERVVREDAGFSVVEKLGEAQRLAAESDPRR